MSNENVNKSNPSGLPFPTEVDEETMKALVDLMHTTRLAQNFLNDQVITDVSKLLMPLLKLLNAATSTDLIEVFEMGLQDPALDKAIVDPPKVGLMGLMKALRHEDAQRGMGILVELLKAIGRAARRITEAEKEVEEAAKTATTK